MIGERIKESRLALGYSAEQVAEFLEVSPTTIYRYENGDISKLPAKHIKPLAEFLGVTPAYLMGWDNNSEPEPESEVVIPKNEDVRVLTRGFNRMPEDKIKRAKEMMKLMFAEYADYFKENDDDPEL